MGKVRNKNVNCFTNLQVIYRWNENIAVCLISHSGNHNAGYYFTGKKIQWRYARLPPMPFLIKWFHRRFSILFLPLCVSLLLLSKPAFTVRFAQINVFIYAITYQPSIFLELSIVGLVLLDVYTATLLCFSPALGNANAYAFERNNRKINFAYQYIFCLALRCIFAHK